jgi:hypothetical protein
MNCRICGSSHGLIWATIPTIYLEESRETTKLCHVSQAEIWTQHFLSEYEVPTHFNIWLVSIKIHVTEYMNTTSLVLDSVQWWASNEKSSHSTITENCLLTWLIQLCAVNIMLFEKNKSIPLWMIILWLSQLLVNGTEELLRPLCMEINSNIPSTWSLTFHFIQLVNFKVSC